MDKRVLVASTRSLGVVAAWLLLFTSPARAGEPQPAAAPAAGNKTIEAKTVDGKETVNKPAEVAATAAADKPAIKETTLELPGYYRAVFSNMGGAPLQWVLLNPQYKEDNPRKSNKLAQPIDLVKTVPPRVPLLLSFPAVPGKSSFDIAEDAMWTEEPRTADGALVYSWQKGDVRVEKRFAPVPDSYQVNLTVTVENKGGKPIDFFPRMSIAGWHDPAVKSGGFMSRRTSQTEGLCVVEGKLKKASLEEMQKKANAAGWGEPIDETGKVHWFGVGEQYFVMAAALKMADDGRRCEVGGWADGNITASLTLDKQTVAAHAKVDYEWALFMGPKILAKLDAVTVGGKDAEMGKAVDYGWTEAVARPMLGVLKGIHAVVPNWGVAIIILTILLKALTWWPTQRSMKSMKAMAKLKPEMDKLKERYGDDKNGMNIAMMELYKKHGVNPLGGCLPVLIQMPIYIALYAMLGKSVELYRSGFVGWIRDLTAADPYYVLPVLTGILMFVQQKTQPASPDPQQQTMMYIMPVMFTAFSIFLPSGLTIYILTNTVLTFVQQFMMNRGDKPSQPSKPMKPARA